MDLFNTPGPEARQRLEKAGWAEIDYAGQKRWLSPDRSLGCSLEQALQHLERQEREQKKPEE